VSSGFLIGCEKKAHSLSPPGTGKTKTISGLVGKWMSERTNNIARPGEKPKKAKLLVCAPSNAAIDEVCKRLMNGVPTPGGREQPNLVRIGMDSSVNDAVKDRSLDNLVEARVSSGSSGPGGGGGEYARIQAELEEVKVAIKVKQDQLRDLSHNDEGRQLIESEYHTLMTRRAQLGQASSKAKDAARDQTRHLEGARRAAKEAILEEADIVCATLSGAGQDILAAYEFETVIIDEAAQAIEMSCLIPLKYGCKRCIMVGGELWGVVSSTTDSQIRINCHRQPSAPKRRGFAIMKVSSSGWLESALRICISSGELVILRGGEMS
jgi:senataxin